MEALLSSEFRTVCQLGVGEQRCHRKSREFATLRHLRSARALRAVYAASVAVIVISAFSRREMGQLAFASAATFWKASFVVPGTRAVTSR